MVKSFANWLRDSGLEHYAAVFAANDMTSVTPAHSPRQTSENWG
jgi:hypothetical protein